jgi:hypothetical protein
MTDHVSPDGHHGYPEDRVPPPDHGGEDEQHPHTGADQVEPDPVHRPKVTLYTAVYGTSDWIKPAPKVPDGVQCLFYTDTEAQAFEASLQGWIGVPVPHNIVTLKGDPRITAPMLAHKWWKCHPDVACPGADISLWVDGSMEINTDDYVERCLEALGTDDWSCVRHPVRGCIYPEGEFSATLTWRYDPESILAQIAFYKQFHPPNWGLIATGANVRRHTPKVLEVSHQWWDECLQWSHQDQLSLPVLLRIHDDVKFNYNLPWFQWWHLHEHGARP